MKLTAQDKETLLKTARSAIERYLADGTILEPEPPSPTDSALEAESGAFVTLHKQGRLRGCIGQFTADGPLVRTVAEMAVSAAAKDPRFSKVTAEELSVIDIEISVLTPLIKTDAAP